MINAIQAEEMSLSIWLRSDGLSFAIYPKGAMQDDAPMLKSTLPFAEHFSLRENVEQCLYEQPELSLPFAQVKIYYTPTSVALVPDALFDESNVDVWETTLCTKQTEALRPYLLEGEDKRLVGAMDRATLELLERSFLMLSLCPSYADKLALLRTEAQQSLTSKLLVYLAYDGITIALIEPHGLSYINRFAYVRPSDGDSKHGEIMYYLGLVWQSLELSNTIDIVFDGEAEPESTLAKEQEELIKQVQASLS